MRTPPVKVRDRPRLERVADETTLPTWLPGQSRPAQEVAARALPRAVLMVRLQVDEDTAFDYLRTLSNTTNRNLSDVAADVVRTRAGEPGFR